MINSRLFSVLIATVLLGIAGGSDAGGITVPKKQDQETGPQPFTVTQTGEILEAGFDETTQEWFCRIEIVVTASGGEEGDVAMWDPSGYVFSHKGGYEWRDVWSVDGIVERFGSDRIATGEQQTTIRRFYATRNAFDVSVGLRWTPPGGTEPMSAGRDYRCT